ncbi:hypothetical protein ACH36K_17120 [Clostridium sp. MB05]|jgi:hypothetical protein|uniref:hypothetical protein n=1 Tax=Clostridium sp. MB05 TaxID=3376682 RepID=UPI003981D1CB
MEKEAIKENESSLSKKTMRDTIYGNLDVSVKTMDRFIAVVLILLTFSIVIGVLV